MQFILPGMLGPWTNHFYLIRWINLDFSMTVDLYVGWCGQGCSSDDFRAFINVCTYNDIGLYVWHSGEYFLSFPFGTYIHIYMLCTAQFDGPVLKAPGRVQYTPFQLGDKTPMITDQHRAGGSVSQLSQLTKLSPWLSLSTKDITTSFWHYKKWFWFLSNQIMGLYHFSNPIE